MFSKIKEFLAKESKSRSVVTSGDEKLHLAAAALLVEAACMDDKFDEVERLSITKLLRTQFDLTVEETDTLINEAAQAVEATGQLYGFTRTIKDQYDNRNRIKIIEMLWEVAFSDGNADPFEQNLIQRVAGLIFVTDKDRGIAKKLVMARLGIRG